MAELNLKILDHFQNPRNIGIIDKADGFGRGKNPINEYITDFYLKIEDETIKDIKFKTFGCTITIAAGSALTEAVKGKRINEIVNGRDSIKNLMGLISDKLGEIPEKNWHCSPTAVQTLLIALQDYYMKKGNEEKVREIEKLIIDVKSYFENYIKNNLQD